VAAEAVGQAPAGRPRVAGAAVGKLREVVHRG
jgi:hypothetical protein